MLERTAGCLEAGSLRRLLPGPKPSLKSRRTLHSSFWNHGAIDLENSPLWQLMLHGPGSIENLGEKSLFHGTLNGSSGVLLDFLYPAGTIKFLRQYSSWGSDKQDGKKSILGLGRLNRRPYTSSAKDTSLALVPAGANADVEVEVDGDKDFDKDETSKAAEIPADFEGVPSIESVLGVTTKFDFEEVWRKYRFLPFDSLIERQIRPEVVEYMAASDRALDAERVTDLFEKCEGRPRKARFYESVIRCFLKLDNLSKATELYKLIRYVTKVPAGSSYIMTYLLTNKRWLDAFNLYTENKYSRYNVLKSLNGFDGLSETAKILGKYVDKLSRNVNNVMSPAEIYEWQKFAGAIIKSTLLNTTSFDRIEFRTLLKLLKSWRLESPQLYIELTEMLNSHKQPRIAAMVYRHARQNEKLVLPQTMIKSMLRIFYRTHDLLGMQEVFADTFRFNRIPDREAYKMCMTAFARDGDADTVLTVWEQYAKRFLWKNNPTISADDIAPLLNAYSRRGNIQRVIEVFGDIESKYNLLPTLLCYNILISAYVKVHEFDKAFESFEALINTPGVKPDDYTFGTLMGIFSIRGDLENAIELYRLSDKYNIEKSAAMVSTVVTAYIAEDRLTEAEKICEDSLQLSLKGSKTRMWNFLLVAWALRYDLPGVNRILQRMTAVNIEYDGDTYAALMQALAMVGQPHRAYDILKDVMPEAGVRITSFHWAIIMGGFMANHYWYGVHSVHERMLASGLKRTASTNFLMVRALEAEARLFRDGTEEQKRKQAADIFRSVVGSLDPREMADTARKGIDHAPLNIAYSSTFFGFITFVLAKENEFSTANDLYEQFKQMLPADRATSESSSILSAMMQLRLQEKNYEAVAKIWEIALGESNKKATPIKLPKYLSREVTDETTANSVDRGKLKSQRFALVKHLRVYMTALAKEQKTDTMIRTVNEVQDMGYELSNRNWNEYVQHLARAHRWKLAFQICESTLMPHWTGWATFRARQPVRNRLPLEVRRTGKLFTSIRPNEHTFLCLLASFLELQAMAAESRAYRQLIDDLEHDCKKTLHALRTMDRNDDDLEQQILGGYF